MRLRLTFALPAIAIAFPFAALADLSGTVTLNMGDRFSFDTGVTSSTNPGTDVRFSGTSLVPQSNIGIFNYKTSGAAGTTLYNSLTQQMLAATPASYTETTLAAAALVVGDVFAVHTTSGYYAKVLITAFTSGNNGSLALQYTTFGAPAGGPNAPMISAIENAATNVPPGLPNAPIAQGALFVVKGKNLGPANAVVATAFPLLASIGGTSIKVTVAGTTVNVIMYYSLAAQIAGILPSKTPAGTGTLTVTYNGLDSAIAPIVVVPNNI